MTPSAKEAAKTGPVAAAFRALYWATWFVALPLAVAATLLWALTPAAGTEPAGPLAAVSAFVRDQPVPVAIILFTLAEIALWGVRNKLPLARYVHPAVRQDVSPKVRGKLEEASALIEEVDMLLTRHKRAIARQLSPKERESVTDAVAELKATMAAEDFSEDAFRQAHKSLEQVVSKRLGRFRKSELREYAEAALLATLVAFGLRIFVVEAFKIPSGSMIPTLQVGDHIFVNKLSYGLPIPFTETRIVSTLPPNRGDVMVFAYPEHPEDNFIKRVIAVPGDTLEVRGGHPIINGWEVPRCLVGSFSYSEPDGIARQWLERTGELYVEFLGTEAYLTFHDKQSDPEAPGPFVVKPGEVFVMGDNRNHSHDSRLWFGRQGGGVPFANIRGRAIFVWLALGYQGFNYSRLFAPVMGRPRLPKANAALQPKLDACLSSRPPLSRTLPPPR